jgi:multidrug resistance protein, MATE family
MNINLIVIIVHILLTYLLTITFGMGIYGPPTALVVSDFIGFFATMMYIQYLTKTDEKLHAAWFWPTKACLQMSGFIEFMKFGVPSIGLVCLDWWSYEIMLLFAAGISVKSIAIQVLVVNNANLFYMPHAAYMISSEILIGTCIGA